MSYKFFVRASILFLFASALIFVPLHVRAGGVCGGTYIVDPGDTFAIIASKCGTMVSAIQAANPGLSEPLKTGQTLTVPGVTYVTATGVTVAPVTVTATITPVPPVPTLQVSFPPYNYYNYYNYYPPTYYAGIYIVQYGDTFASIASRFGVGVYDLWAANPQIWDINLIYVGQAIYVPGSSSVVLTPTSVPVPLSWSDADPGYRKGGVTLSNQAHGDVYVSLRTTLSDGSNAINEYPVSGTFTVNIPAGWIDYVAWVGGVKFTGGFKLGPDSDHTLTFYKNKVVVDE